MAAAGAAPGAGRELEDPRQREAEQSARTGTEDRAAAGEGAGVAEIVAGPAAQPDCFAPWSADTKFFKFPKKEIFLKRFAIES